MLLNAIFVPMTGVYVYVIETGTGPRRTGMMNFLAHCADAPGRHFLSVILGMSIMCCKEEKWSSESVDFLRFKKILEIAVIKLTILYLYVCSIIC